MADQEVGALQRRGLACECGSTQKGPEIGGFRGPAFFLGVCCRQWTVSPDSDVHKDFRQLFDDRNRLVHPKTREIRWDKLEDALYRHPSQIALHETMARLERCIDFLCQADSDIHRNFYFHR